MISGLRQAREHVKDERKKIVVVLAHPAILLPEKNPSSPKKRTGSIFLLSSLRYKTTHDGDLVICSARLPARKREHDSNAHSRLLFPAGKMNEVVYGLRCRIPVVSFLFLLSYSRNAHGSTEEKTTRKLPLVEEKLLELLSNSRDGILLRLQSSLIQY